MPTIEEIINTLKDMGFSEKKAKKALNKTGWSGVEAAAEWLLSHPEEGSEDDEVMEETEVYSIKHIGSILLCLSLLIFTPVTDNVINVYFLTKGRW